MIYDPKRKIVVSKGSSRPCGENHSQISIHAERISINYCRKYDKRNRYHIYIWRYTKKGTLKPIYCCNTCSKLVKKYNYHDKIFTFDEDKIYPAYGKPYLTLGYQIKNLE
jgi:cytidine deaminase